MNNHSSHCTVEFFQFARDPNIGFVCLFLYATHLLQSLNVRIFETIANAY